MILVHPEYFAKGYWQAEVSGRIVRCKTLAEMKKALGPGHKIVGYYPKGYSGTIEYREPREAEGPVRPFWRT